MPSDVTRVAFHLDRDPRLTAAVRTAVQFQAEQAGLDSETSGDLARASEEVCLEALMKLAEDEAGLDVTLDTFPDRIEICIHHCGESIPAVGLQSFAIPGLEGGPGMNGVELLRRVDRVLFNMEEGAARTTLVKFLAAHKPS